MVCLIDRRLGQEFLGALHVCFIRILLTQFGEAVIDGGRHDGTAGRESTLQEGLGVVFPVQAADQGLTDALV